MSWKSEIAKSALSCFCDTLGAEFGRLLAEKVFKEKEDEGKRMSIKLTDLMAPVGVAPKIGQISTAPVGKAGWSKPPVKMSEELRRILALPRRKVPTDAENKTVAAHMTNMLSRANSSCNCHKFRPNTENPCIKTLRPVQAWTLLEIATRGGAIGSIGVGHGKTLLNVMAATVAPGCKVALLLVPPRLVKQLIVDYALLSEHFKVPSLVVHNADAVTRRSATPGVSVLHVMPYSKLSRKDASLFIAKLTPDLIISDEVQRLKDLGTATASRVDRHMSEFPNTMFCGWTGTLTDTSIKEYAHLMSWAFGDGSPLPRDEETLKEWSTALDPTKTFPAPAGALLSLCSEPGQIVHEAYADRLVETWGFISTTQSAIKAKLTITDREPPPMPDTVREALHQVRAWERPDGEELVEATQVATCAKQVACGFYYKWVYPRNEPDDVIKTWFEVRKAWNKELREKLMPMEELLDSPLLCREAADRYLEGYEGELPVWQTENYVRWQEVKDTVKPDTAVVWIDDWLAQDAADWARANLGIVWYTHVAFGAKVAELSRLPMHGGGPDSDVRIMRERGDRSIVASIHAHGTGTDGLQRLYCNQLFANPPSGGKTWEQLLGRLHRIGQESPEVFGQVYRHTEEFRAAIDEALRRGKYVHLTTKNQQKLKDAISW